jgi:hypothetical protein
MKNAILLNVIIVFLAAPATSWSASTSANSGTKLSAASDAASIQCIDSNSAIVDLTTTITSSGAVDSAEIKASIDGGPALTTGWIEPQDFLHAARYKTAVASFSHILSNGNHTVSSCFLQSGADGRLSKQTCAPTSSFAVDCAPVDACAGTEVFGNIIGNGNLCSGQALPIHLKGSFGDGGTLVISKDSFSTTVRIDRAGESCVYQGQYRPNDDGNNGAGVYSFTLLGDNGTSYSFSANLKCR